MGSRSAPDTPGMETSRRVALATLVYLMFVAMTLAVLGSEKLTPVFVMFAGAVVAGYWTSSLWSLVIALPFAVLGVALIDDPGPLENTDSGFGLVILLAFSLPAGAGSVLGVILRRVTRQ